MEGVLVDPGGEPEKLMNTAKELGIDIKEIWLTHGHLDHAGGAEDIRKALNIPVIGPHKEDQFWMDTIEQSWSQYGHAGMGKNIIPDRYLEDGETLTLGGTEFGVLHTPGILLGMLSFIIKTSRLHLLVMYYFEGLWEELIFQRVILSSL
jgi:glyoxylase-like metal-dependent hydrolase (beta-lactamase superfamily II)